MCIRDSVEGVGHRLAGDQLQEVLDEDLHREVRNRARLGGGQVAGIAERKDCLLYTSDAADERSRVDLGGRRIIKKKTKKKKKKKKHTARKQRERNR